MFSWFDKLPPFARHLVSSLATGLILSAVGALTAAGIYKPPVVNVMPADVRIVAPEGMKLVPATAPN